MNALEKYRSILKVESLINELGMMNGTIQSYFKTRKDSVKTGAIALLNTWKLDFQSRIDANPEFIHVDKDYESFINHGRDNARQIFINRLGNINSELEELNG